MSKQFLNRIEKAVWYHARLFPFREGVNPITG